jgi:tRNA-uridine 2-sulfurtransferase
MGKTVLIGLSGGVDSSVAACLLKEQGYSVIGATMLVWDASVPISEGARHACFGPGEEEDVAAAQALCDRLGIPYHTFDLRGEYRKGVLDFFCAEYRRGRTPNPCVRCNPMLKFGVLPHRAREMGVNFDFFATGHYVRLGERNGIRLLRKAADESKDQTYFLAGLPSMKLNELIFPLGEFTKAQVRDLARKWGVPSAETPESQDFIAGGDYSVLFPDGEPGGEIVSESGVVLGRHNGVSHFTIGQRKGLGALGPKPSYVLRIEPETRRVIVTDDPDRLREHQFTALGANWFVPVATGETIRCAVRIRQTHREAPAEVKILKNAHVQVCFDEGQSAVTPGQTAVFYDGEFVLGAAVIDRTGAEPA